MKGIVRDGEAQIKLVVRGPSGRNLQVQAVLDTGSNGSLTLPRVVVETLELPRTAHIRRCRQKSFFRDSVSKGFFRLPRLRVGLPQTYASGYHGKTTFVGNVNSESNL